jgi:RHS repeat-associated protein
LLYASRTMNRASWIVIVPCLIAGARDARADEEDVVSHPQERHRVDSFAGGYATAIAIDVPPYRGLEPDVRLVYDSQGRDGALGRGWSIAGASYIERASAGRGAPRYDAGDVYVRDGRPGGELLPCAAGITSPSCASGGTHATRVESDQRIAFDAAASTWTVTQPDGTKRRYGGVAAARMQTARGTFRWYLDSVEDARGNRVDYRYWTDPGACGDVYLDSVSYGGASVTFYRTARPGALPSFANGACVTTTRYAITGIDVLVGTTRARAYRLDYTDALLTAVTKHGSDATVSGGVVSGGTAAPPSRITYVASGDQHFGAVVADAHAATSFAGYQPVALDLDGDGKSDLCAVKLAANGWFSACAISTGAGAFGPLVATEHTAGMSAYDKTMTPYKLHVTDVDGDGRADLCVLTLSDYGFRSKCARSKGDGGFLPLVDDMHENHNWSGNTGHFGDISGDGKADICAVYGGYVRCVIGNGDGTFGALVVNSGLANTVYYRVRALRDYDGDGRDDLCVLRADTYGLRSLCFHSNGNGTFAPAVAQDLDTAADYVSATASFADLNGDGKLDYCALRTTADVRVRCALGNGDGTFVAAPEHQANPGVNDTGYQSRFADVTGDGLDDACLLWNDATGFRSKCMRGLGNGTFGLLAETDHDLADHRNFVPLLADVDGSGTDDACTVKLAAAGFTSQCALGQNRAPDLLATLGNEFGGTTTVSYAPSSQWPSSVLPLGTSMLTVSRVRMTDGRGHTTDRTLGYSGATWSQAERRFAGFRRASTVLDTAGTVLDVYYCKPGLASCPNAATISRVEQIILRQADGKVFWQRKLVYGGGTAAPFVARVTSAWDVDCSLAATCRSALAQYSYDSYGNVTLVQDYGDYAVTGDERTTATGYVPNPSAYIVSLPAFRNVHPGLGTAATPEARSQFLYDGATAYTTAPTRGLATKQRDWLDRDGSYVETTRTFDARGNVLTRKDPRGATTTWTYDSVRVLHPIRECNALGQCAATAWNLALAKPTSETDANGKATAYSYDGLGRPTRTARPDGSSVTFAYGSAGDPTRQYVMTQLSDGSSDGLWSKQLLDGFGRVYLRTREGGFSQSTTYGIADPTLIAARSAWHADSEPAATDTFAYDAAGRLVSTTHGDGSVSRWAYAVGSATFTDEAGHLRTFFRDPRAHLRRVRERTGTTMLDTSYSYNARDALVHVTDAAGHATTLTYDSLGRQTRSCDPDRGCRSYAYDVAGNLTATTDAAGVTTAVTYDALQRPLTKTGGYAWTYDEAGGNGVGRVTTRTFPGGSDKLAYDAVGRIAGELMCRDTICYSLRRTYDGAGRLASVIYPLVTGPSPTSTETVGYSYAANGDARAVGGYATQLAWNARGQLVGTTLANGVSETFRYDANRQWLLGTTASTAAGARFTADLAYTADGEVSRLAVDYADGAGTKTTTYTYDELHRLVGVAGAQSETFAYDALGNLTASSRIGAYQYGDAAHVHAATRAGTTSYQYDANGNLIARGSDALTWDGEGRLHGYAGTTTFGYDGDGARVKTSAPDGVTYSFGPLLERHGTTLYRYIFVGDRRLARSDGTNKRFFHQDHLGSVRAITDGNGAVVRRYDYRPFGEVLSTSGTLWNHIGFTGHESDATGLVYMTARYHDPRLARLISPDSIVPDPSNPQDLARYSYVRNDPMRYRDPTGHEPYVDHEGHVVGGGGGYSDGPAGGTNSGGGSSGGSGSGRGGTAFHSPTPADYGATPDSPPSPGYHGAVAGYGNADGTGFHATHDGGTQGASTSAGATPQAPASCPVTQPPDDFSWNQMIDNGSRWAAAGAFGGAVVGGIIGGIAGGIGAGVPTGGVGAAPGAAAGALAGANVGALVGGAIGFAAGAAYDAADQLFGGGGGFLGF